MIFGGRYETTGLEHAGGTGTVYVCKDPNLDRRVAVKFLQETAEKRRIYDEVAALQRIRSKHVIQVYDIVIEQPRNQVGVVQEYVSGSDLTAFAKAQHTTQEHLHLLFQLSCGLTDIHGQGLIHRDIKPKNIKIDDEGIVKIFDFDLTRLVDDANTSGFRGTPGYAAPELFVAGPVSFTKAVDAYAFGATALFCVSGTVPPELLEIPPDPEAWRNGHSFSQLQVAIPADIAALLDQCLSKNPTARPDLTLVNNVVSKHLLRDQHRALFVFQGQGRLLDSSSKFVDLSRPGTGTIRISYDGIRFYVAHTTGDVFINNSPASTGSEIVGSCVITIGAPSLGQRRDFITMDISHPEVVL
jgi:serine/threonine protein kinase